jgi:hypothetical protein
MTRFQTLFGVTLGCLMLCVPAVVATPIADQSFFDSIAHTFIPWELDGSGAPVVLGNGASQPMPLGEYASVGVTFIGEPHWVNDAGIDFDLAQMIGGTPENSLIPLGPDLVISFSTPVRAFGLWVISNNSLPGDPVFEARDAGGSLLESVTLSGPLLDGTIGGADYGFMGILSNVDIASIRITGAATEYDNFRFSAVPEPGSLALACLVLLLRRR